jgi:hypothetical protein
MVSFTPLTERQARADVTITGYVMSVSGVNPDGSPYSYPDFVVKGGGLQGIYQSPNGLMQFDYPYMTIMAASGANCIRCYGAKFTESSTDYSGATPAAQANDVNGALTWARNATAAGNPMFVAVGITMQPTTIIDYTNTTPGSPLLQQRALIESFVDNVIALNNDRQLLWIIGNEIVTNGDHVAAYTEINTIAEYIKVTKGSNLPCMTAVPTVTVAELQTIAANCKKLDVLGVNAYYGHFGTAEGGGYLNHLPGTMETSRSQADGWKKPYIVSEFGSYDLAGLNMPSYSPTPPPYVPKATLGLEACSTKTALDYAFNYNTYIKPYCEDNKGCVGSFCYVWQNPVFCTHFAYFYEMFISGPGENPAYNPHGHYSLETAQTMIGLWGGTAATCPQIQLPADNDVQGIDASFKITSDNLNNPPTVAPEQEGLTASVTASYTGSNTPTFAWYIVDDTANHYNPQLYTGTTESTPASATQKTTQSGNTWTNTVTFTAPSTPGNYQLRVNVLCGADTDDAHGTAATAAVFFVVKAP